MISLEGSTSNNTQEWRECMTKRNQFLWSSFVFVAIGILFRLFDSERVLSWPSILISYLIFCITYFVVGKIIKTLKQ